jgi:hypothetical protein
MKGRNQVLAYAFLKATYGEHVRNPVDAATPIIKRALSCLIMGPYDPDECNSIYVTKLWKAGILTRDGKINLYNLSILNIVIISDYSCDGTYCA